MDTEAIALLLELAGRSTAEREEYYAKWQLPTAVRQEIESLLDDDPENQAALADHVPSADLGTLFKTIGPLDARPPNATFTGPAVIGRYQVVRMLGRGGMAEVYLARDPILERDIAVKLIGGELDDGVARGRLVQEARAAGRLRHPNIVTIFDTGEHEGRPYIAMEYVPGETLRNVVRQRQPLPLSRRLELMEGACAGLAHAHRAGVVHLDVKPDNLMVDEGGIVKVLDFGIARVLKSEVLVTRHIVGTLRYMSPEQVAGAPIDRRSDVFSLASSIFELVSYSPAYDGSTQEIVSRIAGGPVPRLSEVVPGINARLDAIIGRAMALAPADRYDDLEEFRADLARLRAELDPIEDARFAESVPSSEQAAAARTPVLHGTPLRSTRGRSSRVPWRLRSITSMGAVAGLAAGAAGFWIFGTPSFGSRVPVAEAPAAVDGPADAGVNSPPAGPPPSAEAARVEPAAPEGAPANEDVWRRLALGDREGVLQIIQTTGSGRGAPPDVALASNVLKAVRTSVLQSRRTAAAAPASASLEPYRSAEERLSRADRLEAAGRPAEALGALWQAGDLYAESIAIGARQPAPAAPEPRAAAAADVQTRAAAAAPTDESPRIPVPVPPAPVEAARPQPAVQPPAESAANPPAARPAAEPPSAPSDADAILNALGRYRAAYEARDVAQVLQVFPTLARDQVEQLQRTFAGMTSYEVEVRDPRVDVDGDAASVRAMVGRRMVPRVGKPVANDVETMFRLRRAGGGWLITAVTAQ